MGKHMDVWGWLRCSLGSAGRSCDFSESRGDLDFHVEPHPTHSPKPQLQEGEEFCLLYSLS